VEMAAQVVQQHVDVNRVFAAVGLDSGEQAQATQPGE
jgi:hypothetical protein